MGKKELECKRSLRKLKAKGGTNAHRNTFLQSCQKQGQGLLKDIAPSRNEQTSTYPRQTANERKKHGGHHELYQGCLR